MVQFRPIVIYALLSVACDAFTTPQPASLKQQRQPLFAKKDDPTLVSSARKQIAFDEEKGRFFETDINDADCIPDEEFCITDNESGNLIRLTLEEKERIFIDALQVRTERF